MPTVSEAFAELLRRIELNPTRVRLAATRYNAVKAAIEINLAGATVKRIGSFQRNTKIRPLDLSDWLDVDGVVILGEARTIDQSGRGLMPAAAIEKVRRALAKNRTYRVMEPRSDAPVVVLEYADEFFMELAVAYTDLTGARPRPNGPACYLVADGSGWSPADYDYDAECITSLNRATAGALVPLIKLIKRMFRTWKIPLNSFHAEVLASNVAPAAMASWISTNRTWGYQNALAYFLANASQALSGPVSLPGSWSPKVDSRLPSSELGSIGQFLANRGAEAWDICARGLGSDAIERWHKFFGDPFPPLASMYG